MMKSIVRSTAALVIAIFFTTSAFAQEAADTSGILHKVIKQNGVAFVGKIISQDAREVLIETKEMGLVYVPKHEIREIVEIQQGEKPMTGGLFSTRYFLTTNGFPVGKGDNYIQWNLFGPDFQFGVAKNFTLGIMTSWVGLPIIGTSKYSFHIAKNVNGGVGFLGGTGSWAFPEYGLVLPYGFITYGDRINNINFSAGYGALFFERQEPRIISEPTEYSTNQQDWVDVKDSEGRMLLSLAGMFRINNKFSFVFDTFFMLPGEERVVKNIREDYDQSSGKVTFKIIEEKEKTQSLLVIAPGLRFQANENNSFQFGFTGLRVEGEFVPVPIPLVQWFRKI